MASSSVRAYLLPMEALPSSNLQLILAKRSIFLICVRDCLNWSVDMTERRLHLTGAILAGMSK